MGELRWRSSLYARRRAPSSNGDGFSYSALGAMAPFPSFSSSFPPLLLFLLPCSWRQRRLGKAQLGPRVRSRRRLRPFKVAAARARQGLSLGMTGIPWRPCHGCVAQSTSHSPWVLGAEWRGRGRWWLTASGQRSGVMRAGTHGHFAGLSRSGDEGEARQWGRKGNNFPEVPLDSGTREKEGRHAVLGWAAR